MEQDPTHPTGVAATPGREDKSDKEVVRARNRKANAAIQLVAAGSDYDEVATVVGYPSAQAARLAVEKALEKELSESDRKILRQLAKKKLEALTRSVWAKAIDPDHPEQLAYNKRAAENVQAWIKLLGLDAPSEMVIYTPAEGELDQWVASVIRKEIPELEQDDIFDAEVVSESEEFHADAS